MSLGYSFIEVIIAMLLLAIVGTHLSVAMAQCLAQQRHLELQLLELLRRQEQ